MIETFREIGMCIKLQRRNNRGHLVSTHKEKGMERAQWTEKAEYKESTARNYKL
jgi:hypothetical protein